MKKIALSLVVTSLIAQNVAFAERNDLEKKTLATAALVNKTSGLDQFQVTGQIPEFGFADKYAGYISAGVASAVGAVSLYKWRQFKPSGQPYFKNGELGMYPTAALSDDSFGGLSAESYGMSGGISVAVAIGLVFAQNAANNEQQGKILEAKKVIRKEIGELVDLYDLKNGRDEDTIAYKERELVVEQLFTLFLDRAKQNKKSAKVTLTDVSKALIDNNCLSKETVVGVNEILNNSGSYQEYLRVKQAMGNDQLHKAKDIESAKQVLKEANKAMLSSTGQNRELLQKNIRDLQFLIKASQ